MPLYEYECRQCHRRTEKIQKFSDVEITVCPHCGGELDRTITAPAVHFSGGGWFKDGYGNAKPPAMSGGEGASEKSDSTTPAAAPATGSGSGESAPATPSAPAASTAVAAPAASASATPAKP
ncbi:MAG: zinc ribbon domain-containing protein [Acidobacteriaceae bacterium]